MKLFCLDFIIWLAIVIASYQVITHPEGIPAEEYERERIPRGAMKAHGGTTDARANGVPTPGSFGGLENREEVIAKPSLVYERERKEQKL